METIILIIFSLLSSSMAQRYYDNRYSLQQFSLNEMISRFTSNTTDGRSYFHAIPAELYYNEDTQRPIKDPRVLFNITGLSNGDASMLMAFPYFPSKDNIMADNKTTNESKSLMKSDLMTSSSENNELTARMLSIPRNRISLINPLNWFRIGTTTTSATTKAPQVINNYIIDSNRAQTPPQPFELPVVYNRGQTPSQSAHLQSVGIEGTRSSEVSQLPLRVTSDLGKVRTPIFTDTVPDLQNIEFSALNFPSFSLGSSDRTITDSRPEPKPEYPSTDKRPPVLELI